MSGPQGNPSEDDRLVEVKAFLRDGDIVACPAGNMAALYRVISEETEGIADFEYVGIAEITGAHNVVRKVKP